MNKSNEPLSNHDQEELDYDLTLLEQAAREQKIKALHIKCGRDILKHRHASRATFRMEDDAERIYLQIERDKLVKRFKNIGKNGATELLISLGVFFSKAMKKDAAIHARLKQYERDQ